MKWEYLVRYYDSDRLPNRFELDALGEERWELIQVITAKECSKGPDRLSYIFKRGK